MTRKKPRKDIIVDALIFYDPKITQLPTDAHRWAYIVTLCLAKWQRPPGRFSSVDHLASIAPKLEHSWARLAEDLGRTGLLIERGDRSVVVPNWKRFQKPPSTERVRKHRAKITLLAEERKRL